MEFFKYAVLDFNGTLFWDTPLHNLAWDVFLSRHNITLTDAEKDIKIHGRTNRDILLSLFNRHMTDTEIREFAMEKEMIYQSICREQNPGLAAGAADILNYFKDNGIRFTLATASGTENIGFYFEMLGLHRWFSLDKISFNDGNVPGKPDPELFLRAYKIIDAVPEQTVIFEDSAAGIRAAERAGAGKIIIVNSSHTHHNSAYCIHITDFNELNREALFGFHA